MRIVAISDTHTKHEGLTIPECDILVHAGDFSWQGKFFEVRDFIYWFKDQPAKHKILIAGNHELTMDKTHSAHNPHVKEMVTRMGDVIYLENSEVVIEGIKFWGTPWTPWFHNWAFNGYSDADAPFHRGGVSLLDVYKEMPEDVNVIISHGPVYGMRDMTLGGDDRTGSVDMRKITAGLNDLRLYISGHIHEARGMEIADGGVHYCNVCTLDRDYETVRVPVVIDIDENGFVKNVEGY